MILPTLRKVLWVGRRILVDHLMPLASGIVVGTSAKAIKTNVLPRTTSPFITGHLLREETIDGAVMAGFKPNTAWAKYALPKGLPTSNKPTLAIENEPHEVSDFSGDIPSGYGAGTKTLLLSDAAIVKVGGHTSIQKVNYHVHKTIRSGGREHYDIVVTGIKPGAKQWELNIPRGEFKGRYAFVKTNGAMIVNRMVDNGVMIAKPDYILRKEDRLADLDPAKVIVERKIDGSLGNAAVKDLRVMFRSHREEGQTYYDKLPAVEWIKNESSFLTSRLLYPGPSLTGTVFQGELAHPEGSARVSGILNSLAPNARVIQEQRGPVEYYVWDILRYKGRDVSKMPYAERRALYNQVVKEIRQVNKYWHAVDCQRQDETAEQFYKRITNEPLPWGEGVVIKPRDTSVQKWDKVKMTGFGYYKLVGMVEGKGKYAGTVGTLIVENPANGARGEAGSLAIPDEFRNWMWNHKEDLIGETVKVRAQETTARGVPRAGVFYGFHDGEIDLLMAAEANAAGTGRTPKEVMYSMKTAAGWRRKK